MTRLCLQHWNSNGILGKAISDCSRAWEDWTNPEGRTEKVVQVLNPYMSSPNLKLILDLAAARSGGVGIALQLLAFLEVDVQNNWRPFKPEIHFVK